MRELWTTRRRGLRRGEDGSTPRTFGLPNRALPILAETRGSLIPDYLTFWGKAQPRPDAASAFHPVAYHLLDVAAVTDALLEARPLARKRAASLLELDPETARHLLVSLAALHDLGKFAPAFQVKAPAHWPSALGPLDPLRVSAGRHTDDGFVLWTWSLRQRARERLWPEGAEVFEALAPAVFGHHGRPVGAQFPMPAEIQRFGKAGQAAALACADAVMSLLVARPLEAEPSGGGDPRAASWWVAGLLTIADWVGSRQEWFRYAAPRADDLSLAHYWDEARESARRAVRHAGLVAPKAAARQEFWSLTGVATAASPAQRWAETVALPPGPLLLLIEDVTGSGKTEAAQMLVHRLMAAGRAGGAYWAMPTQATANAMYARQAKVFDRLYTNGADPKPSLVLSHGQQRLHEQFRATVLAAPERDTRATNPEAWLRTSDAEAVPGSAACAAFLADDRRAALLADVGAGTVDQALLAVLPSKFNAVRLFGLADKVMVVDEAHAYDAYMGVEVQELLRFQAALGGCAIVLSATLTLRKRAEMVEAWQEGAGAEVRFASESAGHGRTARVASDSYPLATLVTRDELREQPIAAAPWSERTVTVRLAHELDEVLARLERAWSAGGAVAWVRNTVDDCLGGAALLRQHGVEAIVFHARFAQGDRQARERQIMARFGKDASAEHRPGPVLVATQVIEQSLDLDFDAMVTDLAPVDLLVQRAGRLWRHEHRNGPVRKGLPLELLVFSPSADADPPADWLAGPFQGTAAVYENPSVLWRTACVLARVGEIRTPAGLRQLVEAAYDDTAIPEALEAATGRAEGKARGDSATATYGKLNVTDGYFPREKAWQSDLRVPTRLGDQQTTVRLARATAGARLEPWHRQTGILWKDWALSEVRLSARKVPWGSAPEGRWSAAVSAAREQWGRFEQELSLLPLECGEDGVWRGRLAHPSRKQPILVRYNDHEGLVFEAPPG